ncbi:hypothetical protein AGLY_007439 [Aphis glycines]|uniref:Uncharacterized protein n=1 Tax=Aphis glycines TaxID=307491 RepID=A0A6G0TM69_APHGL|nr:hypothetical protein AGLY_007439 [Aphis glycines]
MKNTCLLRGTWRPSHSNATWGPFSVDCHKSLNMNSVKDGNPPLPLTLPSDMATIHQHSFVVETIQNPILTISKKKAEVNFVATLSNIFLSCKNCLLSLQIHPSNSLLNFIVHKITYKHYLFFQNSSPCTCLLLNHRFYSKINKFFHPIALFLYFHSFLFLPDNAEASSVFQHTQTCQVSWEMKITILNVYLIVLKQRICVTFFLHELSSHTENKYTYYPHLKYLLM